LATLSVVDWPPLMVFCSCFLAFFATTSVRILADASEIRSESVVAKSLKRRPDVSALAESIEIMSECLRTYASTVPSATAETPGRSPSKKVISPAREEGVWQRGRRAGDEGRGREGATGGEGGGDGRRGGGEGARGGCAPMTSPLPRLATSLATPVFFSTTVPFMMKKAASDGFFSSMRTCDATGGGGRRWVATPRLGCSKAQRGPNGGVAMHRRQQGSRCQVHQAAPLVPPCEAAAAALGPKARPRRVKPTRRTSPDLKTVFVPALEKTFCDGKAGRRGG